MVKSSSWKKIKYIFLLLLLSVETRVLPICTNPVYLITEINWSIIFESTISGSTDFWNKFMDT